MPQERLYIVSYDIADPKRWKRIFKIMKGHGNWLQLSLFQCRLSARRRVELAAKLESTIHHDEDHVLIIELGPAEKAGLSIVSIGKSYETPARQAIVI